MGTSRDERIKKTKNIVPTERTIIQNIFWVYFSNTKVGWRLQMQKINMKKYWRKREKKFLKKIETPSCIIVYYIGAKQQLNSEKKCKISETKWFMAIGPYPRFRSLFYALGLDGSRWQTVATREHTPRKRAHLVAGRASRPPMDGPSICRWTRLACVFFGEKKYPDSDLWFCTIANQSENQTSWEIPINQRMTETAVC